MGHKVPQGLGVRISNISCTSSRSRRGTDRCDLTFRLASSSRGFDHGLHPHGTFHAFGQLIQRGGANPRCIVGHAELNITRRAERDSKLHVRPLNVLTLETPRRSAMSATEYPRSMTCLMDSALNSEVNRWVLIDFLLCSKHRLEMSTVPGAAQGTGRCTP